MSCTQEKYEARARAKLGWQEQKPASLHFKALLWAKLKLKVAARAARAVQARSASSSRETLEISDDEALPMAAAAVPQSPRPEAPAGGKVQEELESHDPKALVAAPEELLTRSDQLQLAKSKKRNKNENGSEEDSPKRLRRDCLSKLALKRTQKPKPSKKNPKSKAKASKKSKASAEAKAKAAAAKPCPKAKAKAKVQVGLPPNAEIRSYHALVKKFKQAREGVFFGDVPKEQRGILKAKIHVSKKYL